jgi:hypothetical protein
MSLVLLRRQWTEDLLKGKLCALNKVARCSVGGFEVHPVFDTDEGYPRPILQATRVSSGA